MDSIVGLVGANVHGARHYPTQPIWELWRYADFPLLTSRWRGRITSGLPTDRNKAFNTSTVGCSTQDLSLLKRHDNLSALIDL